MNGSGVTTRDVMRLLFTEMDLLINKRITPARANATARLALSAGNYANLEVVHHKMKPSRGQAVRPVLLVGQTHEVKALPAPEKKKRK